MKIALCISGQMRNFETRFDSLRSNLLDRYDCDIFIHTWKERGITTDINRLFPDGMNEYFQDDIVNDSDKFVDDWKELLPSIVDCHTITEEYLRKIYPNVKAVVIEEIPIDYEEKKTLYNIRYPDFLLKKFPRRYHNLAMFYKIKACNDLKKKYEEQNNFKYDMVVRMRPDLHLLNKLEFERITNVEILCKSGMDADDYIFDQFFLGNSLTMDLISNLWDSLDEYWDPSNNSFENDEKRTIGYLLYYHCIKNNITVNPIDIKTTLLESTKDSKMDFVSFIPLLDSYIRNKGLSYKILYAVYASISQIAYKKLKKKGLKAMSDALDKPYLIGGYYFCNPPYGRALYFFEKKDFEKSNAFFNIALSLEPKNKKIIKSYAKLLFEQKKFSELFDLLEKNDMIDLVLYYKCSAKMHSDVTNYYNNLIIKPELTDNLKYKISLSFFFQKNYKAALMILKEIEVVKNKRLCANVNYKISQIYFYEKNIGKSLIHINIAIKNSSDPAGLIIFKSRVIGKNERAYSYLLANSSYFTDEQRPVYYYELYSIVSNNLDKAYYYIKKVYEIAPDYRDVADLKNSLEKKLILNNKKS